MISPKLDTHSTSKRLSYEFHGLLHDNIGSHGITQNEIEEIEPRLRCAHEQMQKMRSQNILGFWDLPYDQQMVRDIREMAEQARRFDNLVVVGTGGTCRGNVVLHKALSHPEYNSLSREKRKGHPRIYFINNIDPDALSGMIESINVRKTVFHIVGKASDCMEVMATFLWLYSVVSSQVGKKKAPRHFIVTTDQDHGGLWQIATENGIPTLTFPSNVGARFAVLSSAGLLSAAASGIRIRKILDGAAEMEELCRSSDWRHNPALAGAAFHYLMHIRKGKQIQVFMPYSEALSSVCDWFRQLWSESLGKAKDRDGKEVFIGQTAHRAVGVTDQRSQLQLYLEGPFDKVITFVTVEQHAKKIKIPDLFKDVDDATCLAGHTINDLFRIERECSEMALQKAGRPTCAIRLKTIDEQTVGALLYMLQAQTAYCGELHNINAFNQPGLEQSRQTMSGLVGRNGYKPHAKRHRSKTKTPNARQDSEEKLASANGSPKQQEP